MFINDIITILLDLGYELKIDYCGGFALFYERGYLDTATLYLTTDVAEINDYSFFFKK